MEKGFPNSSLNLDKNDITSATAAARPTNSIGCFKSSAVDAAETCALEVGVSFCFESDFGAIFSMAARVNSLPWFFATIKTTQAVVTNNARSAIIRMASNHPCQKRNRRRNKMIPAQGLR